MSDTPRPIFTRVGNMIRTVFACLLSLIGNAAAAAETVTIYQLDGSVQCQTAEVTTPAQAAATLREAGVNVVSSDSKVCTFQCVGRVRYTDG